MKIIQPPQIETVTRKNIMAVKVPKELLMMADADWYFYLDLRQVKALGLETLDLDTLRKHKELRQYFYFSGEIDELLAMGHSRVSEAEELARHNKFWDVLETHSSVNSLEFIKDPSFDPKRLVYFWSDAYLFYRYRETMPRSSTYFIDYIGGITNEDYDLDKAETILKENPVVWNIKRIDIPHYNRQRNRNKVWNIKRIDIPHYNRQRNRNKAIEFCVRLPQATFEMLVEYYRDEIKAKYWTVKVKESLAAPHALDPFDVLRLKAALK